jgi:hypothetical protein
MRKAMLLFPSAATDAGLPGPFPLLCKGSKALKRKFISSYIVDK